MHVKIVSYSYDTDLLNLENSDDYNVARDSGTIAAKVKEGITLWSN